MSPPTIPPTASPLDPHSREAHLLIEADELATRGRFAEAIALLESVRGHAVEIDLLLGTLFSVTGDLPRAAESLLSTLSRGAPLAEVAPVLGEVYLMQGDLARAIEMFRALPEASLESTTRGNLALALFHSGDARAAVATLEASPEKPLPAEQASLLGEALCTLEEWARGAELYERLLETRTIDLAGMANLALCLTRLGRHEEGDQTAAVVLAQRQLTPVDAANAARVRGLVAQALGDDSGASQYFAYAVQLDPQNPVHLTEIAAFEVQRSPGESERHLRRAVAFAPEHGMAWLTLGEALHHQGRVDEAREAFARAATVKRPAAFAASAWAREGLYLPSATLASIGMEHQQACVRFASTNAPASRSHARLRLGFVSDHLHEHPVGYLVVRVLEELAREHDLFVYGLRVARSSLADRLAAAGVEWREPRSNADLVEAARNDELDVAFDLIGHGAGTRLGAFAARLAPVQVAWAGYPATTGLPAMDVFLADARHVPPSAEPFYVERVLRMPNAFIAWEPPPGATPSSSLAVERIGALTLGSFHPPAALCAQTLDTFAAALQALPGARLLLKASAFDSSAAREPVERAFAARGIARERLSFFGHSSAREHMQALDLVDVALDARTVSGRSTTLECLAMGVPVVTCPGETFASRHATAFVTTAGHADWVVGSTDEYVAKVVELAHDTTTRRALRTAPREALLASPLCDARTLAAALVDGLRS